MKLFAIYIGGEHPQAHIELHDMRFVVAAHIEDTYAELRRQWWGTPKSLHLDCWSELSRADGYAVTLKPEPFTGPERLYYVNLGGYQPQDFTELHKNMFVVAETEQKAKIRALKTVKHWDAFHKDDMYEAEQCFGLQQETGKAGLFIHLEKIADESPAPFSCVYKPIGKG